MLQCGVVLTCYRFVGYFLSAAVVGVAFWATVEIAGGFGPEKSAEWMASFCVSIVESIFMSQPIKVMTNWCAIRPPYSFKNLLPNIYMYVYGID